MVCGESRQLTTVSQQVSSTSMDPLLFYGYFVVVFVVLFMSFRVWLEMMCTKTIEDEESEEEYAVLSDEDDPEYRMNMIMTEV